MNEYNPCQYTVIKHSFAGLGLSRLQLGNHSERYILWYYFSCEQLHLNHPKNWKIHYLASQNRQLCKFKYGLFPFHFWTPSTQGIVPKMQVLSQCPKIIKMSQNYKSKYWKHWRINCLWIVSDTKKGFNMLWSWSEIPPFNDFMV